MIWPAASCTIAETTAGGECLLAGGDPPRAQHGGDPGQCPGADRDPGEGAYDWPGNIRELENSIERGVVLSQGPWLRFERDLLSSIARPAAASPPSVPSPSAGSPAKRSTVPGRDALDEVQRLHILTTLERTGGTVEGPNGAAQLLGLHPNTLRSRLKKLGIRYAPRVGSGTE